MSRTIPAYTSMLKACLDRYGSNGLAGTVAVPVMTGGCPATCWPSRSTCAPVLVELGATVPARGLYVTEPESSAPSTPPWPSGRKPPSP
jgi:FMN reductase